MYAHVLPATRPLPPTLPTPRPPITADTIARIAEWARRHETTFAALVVEWAPKGGLRALAQHIAAHDAAA